MQTARGVRIVFDAIVMCGVLATLAAAPQTPDTSPQTPTTPAPSLPGGRGTVPARDNTAPVTGTGILRGRVLTVDTGAPLRRARVTLSSSQSRENQTVATDELGRYEFRNLAPGPYTLNASKAGYLNLSYGQRRPNETARPLNLGIGQTLGDLDFNLPKAAVIVARITDDLGQPMSGINVEVQQFRYAQGARTLTRVVTTLSALAMTDDRGEIRLSGLPPGEYYLTAQVRLGAPTLSADRRMTYVATYYPGTPVLAEAQPVSVGLGQEQVVSFALAVGRSATISGAVRRPDGAPGSAYNLLLTEYYGNGMRSSSIAVQPNGSFAKTNVLPGNYIIEARSAPSSVQQEFAAVPVKVTSDDVTGVTVAPGKYGSISGRIVFDSGAPAGLRPSAISLTDPMTVFTGSFGRARINDDWTFDIPQATQLRLLRIGTPLTEWSLKAVLLGGKDITDTPLDFNRGDDIRDVQVVLTRSRTTVTGTVTNEQGEPVKDYAVVVFADDSQRWIPLTRFIAVGRPDQQTRFKVEGLPPGRYLAAALEYLETGAEMDPALLGRLKNTAAPVVLQEGQTQTVNLKLVAN